MLDSFDFACDVFSFMCLGIWMKLGYFILLIKLDQIELQLEIYSEVDRMSTLSFYFKY